MLSLQLLPVAVFFLGVPYGFAIMVHQERPDWPRWRKIMVSGLILPLVLSVLPVVALIHDVLRPQTSCSADSCGMVFMFAMAGLIAAAVSAILGLAVAAVALRKE